MTGGADSEALELAKAKGSAADRSADRVAERLAIVAGVDADQVLLDRVRRRANVHSARLPGASLETYRELESRVAMVEPSWSVVLIPPVLPLGVVETEDDVPTERGAATVATAVWAAQRLGLPIAVSGGDEKRRAAVALMLADEGADARKVNNRGGEVTLSWVLPNMSN